VCVVSLIIVTSTCAVRSQDFFGWFIVRFFPERGLLSRYAWLTIGFLQVCHVFLLLVFVGAALPAEQQLCSSSSFAHFVSSSKLAC